MSKKEQQTQRDRERFYGILNRLENRVGRQLLRDCHGRLNWPRQGVYFFYENGESRSDSAAPRVVRVGTHALTATSRTTLWNRLSQHRGTRAGTGNHRGSIFRGHVGRAILSKGAVELTPDTWLQGSSAARSIVENEENVERAVSAYIGAMPFLWIRAEDDQVGRVGDEAHADHHPRVEDGQGGDKIGIAGSLVHDANDRRELQRRNGFITYSFACPGEMSGCARRIRPQTLRTHQ